MSAKKEGTKQKEKTKPVSDPLSSGPELLDPLSMAASVSDPLSAVLADTVKSESTFGGPKNKVGVTYFH